MAASKTPIPPGAWLAKPSNVAETKIIARMTKPILGSCGINVNIASAQKPRSTVPMAICRRVNGPAGKVTLQPFRPTMRGRRHTQMDIEREYHQDYNRAGAIQPFRQLVDGAGGERLERNAEPEHGGIAQPEGELGHETDFRHLDGP
jgi:hypothetical protein